MKTTTQKKLTLALGLASVAASAGNVAVKAGPALQTLNNLTNTAEFTINNTYGQSFSVDGIISTTTSAVVTPFAAATSLAGFIAGSAVLTTNFQGGSFGEFQPVTAISASANAASTGLLVLNAATLAALTLVAGSATQTIGASISSTLFGPSTVKASSSFTNQLINDLSAF